VYFVFPIVFYFRAGGCRKDKKRGSKYESEKGLPNHGFEKSTTSSIKGTGSDSESGDMPKTIYVNLLPLWKGQKKQGVRYAPSILNSMVNEASNSDKRLVTCFYKDDDLNKVSGGENEEAAYLDHMNKLTRKLSQNLTDYKSGDTVLNFGGDHSVSMATIQKMYHIYPDLRVIWIDAHADINSPTTSPSGNFHGMPVFYISDLTDIHRFSTQIALENIAYFGVRDVDVEEIRVMKNNEMTNITRAEIIRRGSSTVLSELIQEKELYKHPVHISFDIDAIDPTECPSTGTTAEDGVKTADVVKLIKKIKETGNLVSMDIVEFNPLVGSDSDVETTVKSIMKIMKEIVS